MTDITKDNFSESSESRGAIWGFIPTNGNDVITLFKALSKKFGQPEITEELVIFFKYDHGDIRIRIDKNSLKFLSKTKMDSQFLSNEIQSTIPLEESENFIRLISMIGYKEGLFSKGIKYTYSKNQVLFTVRLIPNFANFFQIKTQINRNSETIEKNSLQQELNDLNLKYWNDEEYLINTTQLWENKSKEALIDSQHNLNEKIRDLLITYHFSVSNQYTDKEQSIQDILARTNNNYIDLENAFSKFTSSYLVSHNSIEFHNTFNVKASIIIPYFNDIQFLKKCIDSILLQNLTPSQFPNFEVIVVDDGSKNNESENMLNNHKQKLLEKNVKFKFIRSSKNHGRASARNLGASVAENEVLIFLDSDILIETNYIREVLVRHQYLDNIVLVGLKENITYESDLDIGPFISKKPNFANDFRYNHLVGSSWDGIHAGKDEEKGTIINCVCNTNNFKDFGFGKTKGPFDLSCMVVTHNVSLKKKYFDLFGGFNVRFSTTWGYEDTFLGSCLIGVGNFIIPLLSTGVYHLDYYTEKEREIEVRIKKDEQKKQNFKIYKELVNQKGYLSRENYS